MIVYPERRLKHSGIIDRRGTFVFQLWIIAIVFFRLFVFLMELKASLSVIARGEIECFGEGVGAAIEEGLDG